MIDSNSTSKIVIGIGLAALFGVGVAVFAVRAQHEAQVARATPPAAHVAAAEPSPADAAAPAANTGASTATDQSAAASAPGAAPPVAAPPSVAGNASVASDATNAGADTSASTETKAANSKSKSKVAADGHVARTHGNSNSATADTRVASAARSSLSPAVGSVDVTPGPSSGDLTSAASAPATADAQQAAAPDAAMAATPAATSNEPVVSDSQITADVKSQIATAAPNGNVDVTTSNGVVALAGSVPNQDAVDQARQAAQRVAGVKHVDASALTVSNQ